MEAVSTSFVTQAVPWMLTLATVLFGIWKFGAEQAQKNREPFLLHQLELSFEASNAAARLATETDPGEWEKARKTFWRLYWGPLGIVEDPGVEAAMVKLGKVVPREPVQSPNLPMSELGTPSLQLAHAARNLVLQSWDIDLPPLAEKR